MPLIFLPISLYVNDTKGIAYSYGTAVNYVFTVSFIISFIVFLMLIFKRKKLKIRKAVPIYAFLAVGIIALIIQMDNPSLVITAVAESYICCMMYFTIENPDMEVIELLMRNKELSEQSVNDKTNFLFKISQELKSPLLSMKKEVCSYKKLSNVSEKDQSVKYIDSDIDKALFMINDVIDVSSMDIKKFNIIENKYDTKRFFLDIESNSKNQLSIAKKSELINFKFNVEGNYPKVLYGDNIKLKQMFLSLVNNSIKYTSKGFIDIDVDVITRYDACRLLFTIRDSGCGMDIDMLNILLSTNEETTMKEFQKSDNLNLNIPTIIKMLKILGGSINIKSREGRGTTISMVFTQKIDYDATEMFINDVKKYSVGLNKKKRILLLEDNNEYIDKISRIMKNHNTDVISTLLGQDVIDKIKNKDNFDIILLKDDVKPNSAYAIFKELKKDSKFKIPVIVMISKDKEFIKDHYIEDGFSDCIVYEEIDKDIEKIFDKYI